MKKGEHGCGVAGCKNVCPRKYPLCASCWRRVPKDVQREVRAELAKRATSNGDDSELYRAVSIAAASVSNITTSAGAAMWERAYIAAGSPPVN